MRIVSKTSDNRIDGIVKLTTTVLDNGVANNALLIHSGRNLIWQQSLSGQNVAIKAYGSSFIKSLIYIVRKTKAQRAFENAKELRARGVPTPAPLSFGEKRGFMGRLEKSVYISLYEESYPLEKYLDIKDLHVIEEFARFTAEIHRKGIIHRDLNSTNVRVTFDHGKPEFSLIDVNRMKFTSHGDALSLKERLGNTTRFCEFDSNYTHFIKAYVKYSNYPADTVGMALCAKQKHDRRYEHLKSRKKFFKNLFGHKSHKDDCPIN